MISVVETKAVHVAEALANALPVYSGLAEEIPPLNDATHATVMYKDKVMAVLFATMVDTNAVHIGAVLTTEAVKYPILVTKFFKKYIDSAPEGIDEIRIDVLQGYDAGHRFARALGFKAARMSFNQEVNNYVLYVKVAK